LPAAGKEGKEVVPEEKIWEEQENRKRKSFSLPRRKNPIGTRAKAGLKKKRREGGKRKKGMGKELSQKKSRDRKKEVVSPKRRSGGAPRLRPKRGKAV